jgi:excisionase family DNA binding protein
VEENNSDRSINLLTMIEAASILKVSRRTLHRMIKKAQIPAIKIGGQWRFLESRLEEWVQKDR